MLQFAINKFPLISGCVITTLCNALFFGTKPLWLELCPFRWKIQLVPSCCGITLKLPEIALQEELYESFLMRSCAAKPWVLEENRLGNLFSFDFVKFHKFQCSYNFTKFGCRMKEINLNFEEYYLYTMTVHETIQKKLP